LPIGLGGRSNSRMTKAATDVMQAVIFAAVVDSLEAMKAASKGVPNTLLRAIQAVHRNATFEDLPKELQQAITASVRSAFTQLLKEGYAVGPRGAVQQSRPMDRVPERPRHGPGHADRRGPPRGPRRGPPGGKGPRPPRKP
jgi:hypothetical protein